METLGKTGGLPRALEVVAAGLLLAAAAPLLGLAALAILLTDGAPVLFRQARVGIGGRAFTLLKLRTMRASGSGPSVTSGDDPRVTRVGRLLRRTKLDEVPQLWNVLRGDMALVGPRPEVPAYVDRGDPLWRTVLSVRPGLTDPVTLLLRDEEELLRRVPGDRERFYKEALQPWKLRGYARYVLSRTAGLDVAILARTAVAIVRPAPPLTPAAILEGKTAAGDLPAN